MPYREELDAALARAASAEQDLEGARAETEHDHERIAELERELAAAHRELNSVEASAPARKAEVPKIEPPKRPASSSERSRHALLEHVDTAYTALEKHKDEPTSLFGNAIRSIDATFAFALLCATIGLHMWGFPAIGTSPAALACPFQCSGCGPSARIFDWNYRGSHHDEKGREGYALVCSNPKIDIRGLTQEDVSRNKNRQLQPYMVNGITVFFLEGLALVPILFVVYASTYGVRRKRRIVGERATLEDALRKAEAELAKHDSRAGKA